ncbi:MAG: hypothetical protein AAGG02_03955 [Cyanobacteria bacterium P01_H01_bin.15]
MQINEITEVLTRLFEADSVSQPGPDTWKIEREGLRLFVILSADGSWLRAFAPVVTAEAAAPYAEFLLQANFERTQQVRYAFDQGLLWVIFHHPRESLTIDDLQLAIAQLLALWEVKLDDVFGQLIDTRIRQIVQASKQRGQSLTETMQTLTRFYEEGMMGSLDRSPEEKKQFLVAWEQQLNRIWVETE